MTYEQPMIAITSFLPADVHEWLTEYARKQKTNLSAVVRVLVIEHMRLKELQQLEITEAQATNG
jgi:predicted DNA-binding ribbon-helix-helix protein